MKCTSYFIIMQFVFLYLYVTCVTIPSGKITRGGNMAVAALVLGILSLITCWFGAVGWIGCICGVLAIVLGVLGQKKEPEKKGMAKAGMIMGIVALAIGIIMTIACIACIGAVGTAINQAAPDLLDKINSGEFENSLNELSNAIDSIKSMGY